METPLLTLHLLRCGRRRLAITLGSGAGWAVVAFCGVLLLGACFDFLWELPAIVRCGWTVLALAGGVVVLGRLGLLAQRTSRPTALARRLDEVAGSGGEVLTGTDLLHRDRATAPLTDGLASLAVARATTIAGQVGPSLAIPSRPLQQALAALFLLVAGIGLAGWWLPRVVETQWLRFIDPFGDHPPYSRVLFQVEPGDVQVVYGSGFTIRVQTEGPAIERLLLVWKPEDAAREETLPLFLDSDGSWRAAVASVTVPGSYFVRAHEGRSRRFQVTVITVPRLETLRFRVTPPAYTNLPAYEGPLPQGGLAGLPGTHVQVWARSNRPLAGGALEISTTDNATTVNLTPTVNDNPEVAGGFEIRQAGKLHLKLQDIDGQWSGVVFTAPIALLTDERPTVRILEPQPLALATPSAALPVVISAEDDYGITRVELYRSLNDSKPLPVEVPVPTPAPTRFQTTVTLPLADYGLEPGDEIKLFARVEDNNPAGPRGAESRVVVVRIIAQADFEKLVRAKQGVQLLQAKYQQAQRRLEALAAEADRLQKKMKDKPEGDELRKAREETDQLAKKMRADAEALKRLSRTPLDYDLDRHLSEHLETLSRRLEEAAREAERLANDMNLTPEELAEALAQLRDRLHREQQETQRETVDPVEDLAKVQPIMEDASRFARLAERQRSLAERLKSVKDQERVADPKQQARLRDLQAEQEQIRKDLNKLLDDLEDHAEKLPDRPEMEELRKTIADFVAKMSRSGAAEAMTDAETAMSKAAGKRSHSAADKAADILENFCARCQGDKGMMGQGQRSLRFKPQLADGLGDTVEQLLRDAGLNPGKGEGSNSGSSAQASTLDNVGLYGNIPGLEEMPRQPSTRPGGRNGQSQSTVADGGPDRGQRPGTAGSAAGSSQSSAAEAAVPSNYRRRVAEYFQRIADETAGK